MSEYCDGDERADVHESEWRRANKPHKCKACGLTIEPGQLYHRTAMLFDGSWEAWKRCARCQAIFEHLEGLMDSDEYCNPTLSCGHEYRERWGEDPPPEIAALAFWLPKDGPPKKEEAKA